MTVKIYDGKNDDTEGRNSSTIIVGDLNTCLAIIAGTSRQKMSKEIEDLSNTRNQ